MSADLRNIRAANAIRRDVQTPCSAALAQKHFVSPLQRLEEGPMSKRIKVDRLEHVKPFAVAPW